MKINLKEYFTPAAIAQHLLALPELESFIMDLVYQTRPTHPLPVLGVDELSSINTNVPVVKRGSAGVNLSGEAMTITYLEPQPVEVVSFLSATDLNNLKLLGGEGTQHWVRGKVDTQRRAVRATTEALACQSLTGKISYPMKTEGGLVKYEVDFGDTLKHTIPAAKSWDKPGTKISAILLDLIEMGKKIKAASGYGAKIKYLAGQAAYMALADKILALPGDSKVAAAVTEHGINLAGFEILLARGGYRDLLSNEWTSAVADWQVLAVAVDAPFKLFYCALDDLNANLLPMPFYSRPIVKDYPSGYEIVGMSKPVPVPAVKAICQAPAVEAP